LAAPVVSRRFDVPVVTLEQAAGGRRRLFFPQEHLRSTRALLGICTRYGCGDMSRK
jgi:hypothetical protein